MTTNSKSTTIKLREPITVDGTQRESLTLRRPKVRDLLAAEKSELVESPALRELKLFANLCEVPPAALEELDAADYVKLQEAYTGFLS